MLQFFDQHFFVLYNLVGCFGYNLASLCCTAVYIMLLLCCENNSDDKRRPISGESQPCRTPHEKTIYFPISMMCDNFSYVVYGFFFSVFW